MSDYRLYFLNAEGHIRHAVEFQCADDEAAKAQIQKHADGRDMELWCAPRRVTIYEASHKA